VLALFKPNIVINMVQSEGDLKVGAVVQSMLRQYLGIHISIATSLPLDPMVRKAARQNRPVILVSPDSDFSRAVRKLAEQCE